MNLIPFKVYSIITSLIALALIIVPWLSAATIVAKIIVTVIGIILLVTSNIAEGTFSPLEIISTRIQALIVFISAILIAFAPRILGFADQTTLVYTSVIGAVVLLALLIITNITLENE